DWCGVNPCPPELVLLPRALPFHPWRYYCHTRYIYLAMACLYGARVRAPLGPLADELRDELYGTPWATLDFAAHRDDVAPSDLYVRPAPALRAPWRSLDGLGHGVRAARAGRGAVGVSARARGRGARGRVLARRPADRRAAGRS